MMKIRDISMASTVTAFFVCLWTAGFFATLFASLFQLATVFFLALIWFLYLLKKMLVLDAWFADHGS